VVEPTQKARFVPPYTDNAEKHHPGGGEQMEQQTLARKCRDDGSIRVHCSESLTIDHAADFAACIRDSLAAANRVEVEFSAECTMDITALQALCSACKTAAATGKSLTCQGPVPLSLQQLIIAAGAQRVGPCLHNNGNPCPWFGGQP
jgi:hypothetical protein